MFREKKPDWTVFCSLNDEREILVMVISIVGKELNTIRRNTSWLSDPGTRKSLLCQG